MPAALNKKLMKHLLNISGNIPHGLFRGSTGACLVAGLSDTGRAGEAVRGLVEGLKTVQHDLSIASGMPGVAIAADVLARYVSGQGLAGVLADVDAPMYRVYGNGDFPKDYSRLADGVVYTLYRLSYGAFVPTERSIWLRALGMLAEALTEHMRHNAEEAFRFSLNYRPAACAAILGFAIEAGLDKGVWRKKLSLLLPFMLEIYPYSAANRLYYAIALKRLLDAAEIRDAVAEWHLERLKAGITPQMLVDAAEGRLYMSDGLSGICLLALFVPWLREGLRHLAAELRVRVDSSAEIERLRTNESYLRNHAGLWDGLAGIELVKFLIGSECVAAE